MSTNTNFKYKFVLLVQSIFVFFTSFYIHNHSKYTKTDSFSKISNVSFIHSTTNYQNFSQNHNINLVVDVSENLSRENEKIEQLDEQISIHSSSQQTTSYYTKKAIFLTSLEISKHQNWLYILYCSLKIHLI